jgi:YbgC/YbaW family acyl-CoA thioester hydrolase
MFRTETRVYFYDADPAGIIFYASIFRFAHSAYEDFMRNLNLEKDYFFNDEIVLPIIHTEADYINPIKVGEKLIISVIVSQLREKSFELSYNFSDENEKVRASAKTVHVCVNKNGFKKVSLPVTLYEKLKGA